MLFPSCGFRFAFRLFAEPLLLAGVLLGGGKPGLLVGGDAFLFGFRDANLTTPHDLHGVVFRPSGLDHPIYKVGRVDELFREPVA